MRASSRDRREMLEDALGLKVYHFRIRESESKLAKTTETLKEVQLMRRELAPHLNFLKKQVEKVEKGRAIREELQEVLVQYLAIERAHLSTEDVRLAQAHSLISSKQKQLEALLATLPEETIHDTSLAARDQISKELQTIREKRRGIESRISRMEGMIEAQRQMLAAQNKQQFVGNAVTFSFEDYQQLLGDIELLLTQLRDAESIDQAKAVLSRLEKMLSVFKNPRTKKETVQPSHFDTGIKDTALELEDLERELKGYISKEEQLQTQLHILEQEREASVVATQAATKKRYEVIGEIKQCEAEQQILAVSKSAFAERKQYFDTELKEAGFLFGPSFLHALQTADAVPIPDMQAQKRTIDRFENPT